MGRTDGQTKGGRTGDYMLPLRKDRRGTVNLIVMYQCIKLRVFSTEVLEKYFAIQDPNNRNRQIILSSAVIAGVLNGKGKRSSSNK